MKISFLIFTMLAGVYTFAGENLVKISGLETTKKIGNSETLRDDNKNNIDKILLNETWKTRDLSQDEIKNETGITDSYYSLSYKCDAFWKERNIPDILAERRAPRDYVRWYRKTFIIPNTITKQIKKGNRVFLRFIGACDGAKVWINGKYLREHWGEYLTFDCDVTEYINVDKPNLVAVRLFYPKFVANNYEYTYPCGKVGGLRGGVELLLKPDVFIDKCLIDTRHDGSLRTRIFLDNTGSKKINATFSYVLKKYGANSVIMKKNLGKILLNCGRNLYEFKDKIENIDPWCSENPTLYEFELILKIDGKIKDVSKNIIGFRTFEVRGKNFYFNGKIFYTRGFNKRLKGCSPQRDYERSKPVIKWIKDANVNFVRTHAGLVSKGFLRACDEAGILVLHGSMWFASGTPYTKAGKGFYEREKAQLIEAMSEVYNHPCVVAKKISNEMYCPENIPLMNKLYDDLRKFAPYHPIMTSTVPNQLKWANMKREISDYHIYDGWYGGPPRQILFKTKYNNKTHQYPLITSEIVCNYLGVQPLLWKRWLGEKRYKNMEERIKQHAKIIKIQIEIERMHPEIFTGGAFFKGVFLHEIEGNRDSIDHIQKVMAQVYSPILVCADIENNNYFSGEIISKNIYCINDSPDKEVKNADVKIWLTEENNNKPIIEIEKKNINIKPNSRMKIPLDFTLNNISTGFYTLHFALKEKNKILNENYYSIFIMKKKDAFIPVYSNEKKILLLASHREKKVKEILDSIPISYKSIDFSEIEYNNLDDFNLVIIPPILSFNSFSKINGKKLKEYVKKGGRVLFLEQSMTTNFKRCLPLEIKLCKCLNSFVDILQIKHPIFGGLNYRNFDTWNDIGNAVSDSVLYSELPIKTVLAQVGEKEALGHGKPAFGAVIYDFGYGHGEYLLSQLIAVDRYGKDPVSTRYFHNLLNYMLKDKSVEKLTVIKEEKQKLSLGNGPFVPDNEGFIRNWLICGPFPNPGGRPYGSSKNQMGFNVDFFKSIGGETKIMPKAGDAVMTEFPLTKGYWDGYKWKGKAIWEKISASNSTCNLFRNFSINQNVIAYACCYIESSEERKVKIKLGSDDGYKLWFNHKLVGEINICRSCQEDQNVYIVPLKKGFVWNEKNLNILLIKIIQDTGSWKFTLRFTDLNDKPINDLKIWLSPKTNIK